MLSMANNLLGLSGRLDTLKLDSESCLIQPDLSHPRGLREVWLKEVFRQQGAKRCGPKPGYPG